MISAKSSATLLAFVMCCALGCSELSELTGLQDDTSNDCVYALHTSSDGRHVRPSNSGRRMPIAQPRLLPVAERSAQRALRPGGAGPISPRSGTDLLRLLSIQRT